MNQVRKANLVLSLGLIGLISTNSSFAEAVAERAKPSFTRERETVQRERERTRFERQGEIPGGGKLEGKTLDLAPKNRLFGKPGIEHENVLGGEKTKENEFADAPGVKDAAKEFSRQMEQGKAAMDAKSAIIPSEYEAKSTGNSSFDAQIRNVVDRIMTPENRVKLGNTAGAEIEAVLKTAVRAELEPLIAERDAAVKSMNQERINAATQKIAEKTSELAAKLSSEDAELLATSVQKNMHKFGSEIEAKNFVAKALAFHIAVGGNAGTLARKLDALDGLALKGYQALVGGFFEGTTKTDGTFVAGFRHSKSQRAANGRRALEEFLEEHVRNNRISKEEATQVKKECLI